MTVVEDVISSVPRSQLLGWLTCGRLGASVDHARADLELAGALASTLPQIGTIRAIDEEQLERTIQRLERRHVSCGWIVKRERGVDLVRVLDRHYAASRQAGLDRLERERADDARLEARRAAQPPSAPADALWLERAQRLSAGSAEDQAGEAGRGDLVGSSAPETEAAA